MLEGLAPGDVCEAAEGVWFSLTDEERREAASRIVRRRQRASVFMREAAGYTPIPDGREQAVANSGNDNQQRPGRSEAWTHQ